MSSESNPQRWLLQEVAQGEVVGYGHAESGNDLEVLYAVGKAERVDGGYRFTGRKNFGSLTPASLCIYGMDTSDAHAPQIVHAFLPRDTPDPASRRPGIRSECP